MFGIDRCRAVRRPGGSSGSSDPARGLRNTPPADRRALSWSRLAASVTLLSLISLTPALSADWLVTNSGEVIETKGTWKARGAVIVYTGGNGVLTSIRQSAVDLVASQTLTAQGGPGAAEVEPTAPQQVQRKPAVTITNSDVSSYASASGPPKIVMYSTSWCGVCKRARALLTELEADFIEKDIERDPVAALEYQTRSPGRVAVPLLDYGGNPLSRPRRSLGGASGPSPAPVAEARGARGGAASATDQSSALVVLRDTSRLSVSLALTGAQLWNTPSWVCQVRMAGTSGTWLAS